ncbi:MAG TPA: hypothetical protein PLP71_09880 [Syntrophomonadaceae bacterium]|nr:hypothetical protein [Syntrophomonadaceae bacterium]
MRIELETFDFDIILACFWCNEDGKWEGTIKKDIENNTNAKIIVSDKITLVIRQPGDTN